MKIVNVPKIRCGENETAGDILFNFFCDLGWDNESYILDPRKIKTTKTIFNSLYDAISEKCPDPASVGMLMVNQGPGVDKKIKEGKVHLYNGWIKKES